MNTKHHAPTTPALDYEQVKDVFYTKLERDRHGRGRMESAFFHTAQWIFKQGCQHEDTLCARIVELEAEKAALLAEIATTRSHP